MKFYSAILASFLFITLTASSAQTTTALPAKDRIAGLVHGHVVGFFREFAASA